MGVKPLTEKQDAWLAKNDAEESNDPLDNQQMVASDEPVADPMQGLEGLDVAGPRLQ